jgi:hypothetical protein
MRSGLPTALNRPANRELWGGYGAKPIGSADPERSKEMTDHKKKGDFDQSRKHDVGGNKKQDNSDNTPSRTGNQNAGHGGHS